MHNDMTKIITRTATVLTTVYAKETADIRRSAHELHASVNQFYCNTLPYGVHLDMVAENVVRYADPIILSDKDILPVFFAAYYHDSIEDARLTYNDVIKVASGFMPHDRAVMAAEIVYALTNEKGRTRAERADERYYAGIRTTPYAPLVKMADRLANMTFSASGTDVTNQRMLHIYSQELPHFIKAVSTGAEAPRPLCLPPDMIKAISELTI